MEHFHLPQFCWDNPMERVRLWILFPIPGSSLKDGRQCWLMDQIWVACCTQTPPKMARNCVIFNIWAELSLNLERRWDAGLPNELQKCLISQEQSHLGSEGREKSAQGPYKGIFLLSLLNHCGIQTPPSAQDFWDFPKMFVLQNKHKGFQKKEQN